MTDVPSMLDIRGERVSSVRYDGRSAKELAELLHLPRVVVFDEVPSTLDVAHELGEQGAEAGTLVLADAQTAGRGRMGRVWRSEPGAGVWLTLLERPTAGDALGVVALRIALAIAPALDSFSASRILLKWPNDLYVGTGKLAGVLIEARWRGSRLDWLAIGIGINVRAPRGLGAAGLDAATDRVTLLEAIVPSLRSAVAAPGLLTPEEVRRFTDRDIAVGRRCTSPGVGVVAGIDARGALLVETGHACLAFRAGSLDLVEAEAPSLGEQP